jgi:phosphomannomutase/phosphoglucomutase
MIPAHVFREYDIRGVAERDLSDELIERIGRALALLLPPERAQEPPHVVVARDCRLSSPRLFEALVHGLVAGGVDVIDVGVGPTPMMYFSVHALDADGGVMITGSHNAAEDNGLKIMRGKASFFGADLQRLRDRVERGDLPSRGRGSIQTAPMDEAYLDELRASVHLDDASFGVVIDAGNGAAGPIGLKALTAAGLRPLALHCEMDGAFPHHHPDPTVPENLEELIAAVRREDALVGIAWDGDGDRLGVVDRTGEIVWGDRLLALFARDLLRARPGAAVLGEVKCSQSLFDDVARHGGRPILWKTGHSLIKTKMKESGALLAGEMSGHFFFADRYYGYDDGIYAALRLLEILSRERRSVGELLRDLPHGHATPEIRVDCPDAIKLAVVDEVRARFRGPEAAAKGVGLVEIDGARITWPDGAWGLVRASNTGPILVLRFEAPSAERLAEIRGLLEGMVEQARTGAAAAARGA